MLVYKSFIEQKTSKFRHLNKFCAKYFTPRIYNLLFFFELNCGDTKRAAIARERSIIPELIFSIESFEADLLTLAKKSKVFLTIRNIIMTTQLNLMKYVSRASSRDFKINPASMAVSENSDKLSNPSKKQRRDEGEGEGEREGEREGEGEGEGEGGEGEEKE